MADIVLLDGSIGQELVKRSNDRATPLWSTAVMMAHPDLVGQVHADYFNAGATVASTNTYAVHRSRLERVNLADKVTALLDVATDQATKARDAHGSGRIAGTVGPLLASYRPDLNPDPDDAAKRFSEIATHMAPDVDLFLIETVSSTQEAIGALKGVTGHGKPVWIAFSVDDFDGTKLRSGEDIDVIQDVVENFDVEAVLINCSRPEVIANALPTLAKTGLPFGAYANGFTKISEGFKATAPTVDALEQRVDLGPDAYADVVMNWVDQGATIVGGCCEIGPEHIAEIARRLTAAGHRII